VSRATVRSFKKSLHAGTRLTASEADIHAARDAALQLLRHSVKHRHPRLAIIRLLDAVKLEAAIDDTLWDDFERLRGISNDAGQREALRMLRASHRLAGPE